MFSTKKAIFVSAHGLAVMSFDRGLFQDNISAESSYTLVSGAKPKVVASSSASDAKYYRLADDAGDWHWGIKRMDCAAENPNPCHSKHPPKVTEYFTCEQSSRHTGEGPCKDEACWTTWMTDCFVHTIIPNIKALPSGGGVQAAVLSCSMNVYKDCGKITAELYQGDFIPGHTEKCNSNKDWVNSCTVPDVGENGKVSYTFLLNDVL